MPKKPEYKTTEAKRKTNAAYEATLDKTFVRFTKGAGVSLAQVREYADKAGESVNAYIVRAIRERMEREEVSE